MIRDYNVGELINGFVVLRKDDLPDYSSTGYTLKHEKTGFEIFFMKNSDRECFFTYTVYTPPVNSTGVFHILEHTLLTGSKKYPVRDPFMMMVRNSCNTFLNAMTGPDRTYYPAASPVKKDFDNIFNVYTDAVFDPLLRKESFMQEGIRFSSEGGLHFEGVVFSEMQGDISQHESVVASAASRPLFDDDSPYRHEFGGNPPDICNLTYEEFIATYKKHYVPANMTLFFYGDLDLDEKLKYLDEEYLSSRDGGEKVARPQLTERWSERKFVRETSNAEEGNTSSTVMLSWLLEGAENPRLNTELSLIVDLLLGNPGSPLYKAIVESGLGRDLSSESGMADSYRELLFSVGISGADEKDSEKIEEFLLSSLRKIVSEGLSKMSIEASLRRMEFRLKEIPSGISQGYSLFFSRIDKGWAYGKNPADMLAPRVIIAAIRKSLEEDERYLEKQIEKLFIDNPHRLLAVIAMDENNQERIDREIAEKTESLKHLYSKEEEELYLLFSESEESDEDLETLPRLNMEDIPNENIDIPHDVNGNIISAKMTTGGIVYADMAFDVSDYSYEELEDLSVLSRLLLMTNVGNQNYSDFLTELRFKTGAASFMVEAGTDSENKDRAFIYCRFKALKEYFPEALELFGRLFREFDYKSTDRIKAALTDIETDFQSSVLRYGHQYAVGSASSVLNPSLYTTERIQGLLFWYRVDQMLSSELSELPQRLKALAEKTFTSSRLTFHISCEERDEAEVIPLIKEFNRSLNIGTGLLPYSRTIDASSRHMAYTISSPVSYVSLASPSAKKEDPTFASERMMMSLASKNSLWSLIREKGGAYGAGGAIDTSEEILYFYTYRDPRIDGSIDDFTEALKSEEITDSKLEDGKLNILSRDVKPIGPSSKAILDLRRYLYKISDELRKCQKEAMLALTIEDVEKARDILIERVADNPAIFVLTDAKLAADSRYDFEVKSLPIK